MGPADEGKRVGCVRSGDQEMEREGRGVIRDHGSFRPRGFLNQWLVREGLGAESVLLETTSDHPTNNKVRLPTELVISLPNKLIDNCTFILREISTYQYCHNI